MEEAKIEAALHICNILPAHLFEETIKLLSKVDHNLTNNILINKEGPIKIKFDSQQNKHYLGNMFNKEKDSYRSPHSNRYYPEHCPNGYIPSESLRTLEMLYNEMYDRYRKAYYIGGLSSVYLWPNPIEEGFVACFLIKKKENYDTCTSLTWEGTHLIQKKNEMTLSASINKALETPKKVSNVNLVKDKYFHMHNMGKMIEGIENSLRKSIEYIYLPKMNDILNSIRMDDSFSSGWNNADGRAAQNLRAISSNIALSRGSIQDELRLKLKSRELDNGEEYSLRT
ncbi:f-actin capping protein beta subunit [Plasmodium cynomolgi strain B]|uniref:F-actin-capping protein subunit beta n=1 Tax=Plasmodium cynomolgi (strain B) TaxID=1120755 RepID=K6VCE3_PLACD|nr:f-actin capping protein beta subunit [Plasmodium cynomolgi strain B]GAB66892.1 f-actin capping protein beta subunit [Plasmodium cynomolgi strain B]